VYFNIPGAYRNGWADYQLFALVTTWPSWGMTPQITITKAPHQGAWSPHLGDYYFDFQLENGGRDYHAYLNQHNQIIGIL
jgi:hypothetical protein